MELVGADKIGEVAVMPRERAIVEDLGLLVGVVESAEPLLATVNRDTTK